MDGRRTGHGGQAGVCATTTYTRNTHITCGYRQWHCQSGNSISISQGPCLNIRLSLNAIKDGHAKNLQIPQRPHVMAATILELALKQGP